MDKVFCYRETKAGRRDCAFSERETCRRRTKMCLSRRGFYKNTTVLKTWMWRVSNLAKFESDRRPLSPDVHGPTGWTWSSLSGLRSRGAAAAFRPTNAAPFSSCICALKTRFSTPISPLYPFPIPPKCTHFFQNRVFLRSTAWREDRCLAHFLSSIHEERTNADVNTGNDTNNGKTKRSKMNQTTCMK